MVKKIITMVVIAVGTIYGCFEYIKAADIEEKRIADNVALEESRRAAEIAAQEEYDTFIGTPLSKERGEGFFSRTKNDLTQARVANISARGRAFKIAKDQDGYREVMGRMSYAGNTIVRPEAHWVSSSKDRFSQLYSAFQIHCIDSYIQYMQEEKHMPQDQFKVKEVFIDSGSGYYPTEDNRSMTSDMILMIAYGKHAWGNSSTKEYAIELKCAMDNVRNIKWQSKGY